MTSLGLVLGVIPQVEQRVKPLVGFKPHVTTDTAVSA
jgi:hypothetical protein